MVLATNWLLLLCGYDCLLISLTRARACARSSRSVETSTSRCAKAVVAAALADNFVDEEDENDVKDEDEEDGEADSAGDSSDTGGGEVGANTAAAAVASSTCRVSAAHAFSACVCARNARCESSCTAATALACDSTSAHSCWQRSSARAINAAK